jgi:hypothetical protein
MDERRMESLSRPFARGDDVGAMYGAILIASTADRSRTSDHRSRTVTFRIPSIDSSKARDIGRCPDIQESLFIGRDSSPRPSSGPAWVDVPSTRIFNGIAQYSVALVGVSTLRRVTQARQRDSQGALRPDLIKIRLRDAFRRGLDLVQTFIFSRSTPRGFSFSVSVSTGHQARDIVSTLDRSGAAVAQIMAVGPGRRRGGERRERKKDRMCNFSNR